MKKVIILTTHIVLLGILMCSCSPQKRLNNKIKRMERFAAKHGLQSKEVDVDTFVVEKTQHDTVTKIIKNDTVIIRTETLPGERPKPIIKYFYDHTTDSIFIHSECPSDTIVKQEYHNRVIKKPAKSNWLLWLLLGLILLLLIKRELMK